MQQAELSGLDTLRLIQLERDSSISHELWRQVIAELSRRSPAEIWEQQQRERLQCPRCGSQDVKKLSLVHEEGTTRLNGAIYALGAQHYRRAGAGVSASAGVVTGTAHSDLATRAAPPAARDTVAVPFVAMVMVWTFVAVLAGVLGAPWWFVWSAASIAAIATFRTSRKPAADWNRFQLPLLMAQWDRKWLCRRCGEAYEVRDVLNPS